MGTRIIELDGGQQLGRIADCKPLEEELVEEDQQGLVEARGVVPVQPAVGSPQEEVHESSLVVAAGRFEDGSRLEIRHALGHIQHQR